MLLINKHLLQNDLINSKNHLKFNIFIIFHFNIQNLNKIKNKNICFFLLVSRWCYGHNKLSEEFPWRISFYYLFFVYIIIWFNDHVFLVSCNTLEKKKTFLIKFKMPLQVCSAISIKLLHYFLFLFLVLSFWKSFIKA